MQCFSKIIALTVKNNTWWKLQRFYYDRDVYVNKYCLFSGSRGSPDPLGDYENSDDMEEVIHMCFSVNVTCIIYFNNYRHFNSASLYFCCSIFATFAVCHFYDWTLQMAYCLMLICYTCFLELGYANDHPAEWPSGRFKGESSKQSGLHLVTKCNLVLYLLRHTTGLKKKKNSRHFLSNQK